MILHILTNIILPVFIMIGIGVLVDRTLKPDLTTLSRVNFYVFVPALIFIRLVDSRLSGELVLLLTGFNIIHMALLLAISWLAFGLPPFRKDRQLLTTAALFSNCGNYGLPFAQLAFGDFGVQVMAIIVVVQNVASYTLGLWLMGDEDSHWKTRILGFFKTPVLYAVAAALLINIFHIHLPEPLHYPLEQIGNALIPVALLTLGVQLSRSRWGGEMIPLSAANLVRLVISPLLAAGMVWAWKVFIPNAPVEVFPVLVCAAALPVAVNVYILALEYQRQPELASRIVFWGTLASAVTLTAWLALYSG